ncbi:MAG: GHKL domain-containing protein [Bacteroidales bacterium]|nr:GHKL domain-containing protein [Bacteroidales bacterium]
MKNSNLLIRLLLMVLTSCFLSWLIFLNVVFYWPLLTGLFLILQVFLLLSAQNILNRHIARFFRSVRNSDHSFGFRYNAPDKYVEQIYSEMQRINQLVKELKIELETQETYYKVLLEKVYTGILTIDSHGFIKLANQAAHHILDTNVLTHIDHIERLDLRLFSHLKNKQPKERIVLSLTAKNRQRDISVITQSLIVRDESLLLVILQDIRTELDEKELDSWIRLIRVQAHEIRNSLAPIAAVAESLISSSENESVKKGLNIILDRSRHLSQFVDSYRKLTHLPEPDTKLVNLPDLIDRVRILLSDLPNYNLVKVSVENTSDAISCLADPNQLTQVLINLLRNAYEALENHPTPELSIKLEQKESSVSISINDNGPGIPPDQLDEIFVPFFTTKSSGTGIGLSLSKQIIRKHGGELSVESKEGIGSNFKITLNTEKR